MWNSATTDLQRKMALVVLGGGLHSLQDIEGHGNEYNGFLGHAWDSINNRNPDWLKYDWADSGKTILKEVGYPNSARFKRTEASTKIYLAIFRIFTGQN